MFYLHVWTASVSWENQFLLLCIHNIDIDTFYFHVWTWCVYWDYTFVWISAHNIDIDTFYLYAWIWCVCWVYPLVWFSFHNSDIDMFLPSCTDWMCLFKGECENVFPQKGHSCSNWAKLKYLTFSQISSFLAFNNTF